MSPGSELGDPHEVDARGLRCPLPVIRLAEAARDARVGTRFVVLADDPAARYDIPAWCRMRGHELAEMTQAPAGTAMSEGSDSPGTDGFPGGCGRPTYLRFVVLIRAQRPKAGGTGSGSERSSRAM